MGVAAVAHYAVPMSLVQRSAAIFRWRSGATSFPRMSSLSGEAAHTLGRRALSDDGLWLRHHLRTGNDPVLDLLSILDQR